MRWINTTLSWQIGSCVFCAPLDQYIGRHIDQHSTDVSVDISTRSVNISTDTWPICQPTYRPTLGRNVDWDVPVDILPDISVEYRSIDGWILSKFFFACLWTKMELRSINARKKNEVNTQPSWPRKLGQKRIYYLAFVKFFSRDMAGSPKRAR